MKNILLRLSPALALLAAAPLHAADEAAPAIPTITVNVDKVKGPSSPILFGMMTEDINYCLDGGLYGELLGNRTFQEPAANPKRWSMVLDPGAAGDMTFDRTETYNAAQPVSLKLTATTASAKQRVGVANEGYWGIPVKPNTTYRASFYAKADGNFTGPIAVAISSTNSPVTYAYATVPKLTNTWQKYEVTLQTDAKVKPTKDADFLLWTTAPGTVWISQPSLFPPTFNNRPNGNRPDLMELMAGLKPSFLRFPGGNFLEGHTVNTWFNWKKTLGPIAERPGHANDSWNYYSDDGVGLLEYLEWCEDLHMQPVLGVFAGLFLGGGGPGEIQPGADLQPYVQDALDEIEYIIGDVNTKWGAQRAKDGHPEPFKLTYVEIGNEDWRGDYNGRFTQFHDAIKAKYPNLQLIDSSVRSPNNGRVASRIAATNPAQPDVVDSHLYTNSQVQSEISSTGWDNYPRNGPKVFEGEWATRVGAPTPNFTGALGDAVYMTGLLRNSDVVIMASYAPLFVNVSNPVGGRQPGTSMQWPSDLIGYDALNSYGSPSYYAQVMFSNHRGDEILTTSSENIPIREGSMPGNRGGAPTTRQLPGLYYVSTRDSKTGKVFLNVVNLLDQPQPVHIDLAGAASVDPNGTLISMAAQPTDTNSIAEPKKVVPVTTVETGFSSSFNRTLAPYSINIFEIGTK
ncbi:MAG TPA: alpha-L-arabinofuranosidase C-terminal domain-containing protein [Opitutales bacterium]|nr:alpha-L-arabinofuranosidase C-terminal domain-containing protein [Opitutales bacterium]